MKNQLAPYVEVKTVTWCKDSHGLFDYESKNITFTKNKVEASSRVYCDGNNIAVRNLTKFRSIPEESLLKDPNYLYSITPDREKNDTFNLLFDRKQVVDDNNNNKLFLVVRSLKGEDGTPKGCELEVGDVVRLGRIEYRVIEYQDDKLQVRSLLGSSAPTETYPFNISVKDCNDGDPQAKKQCRICLMDEQDTPEALVNPCNCKGTSEYVHIQCLQDWITSKLKKKMNPDTTCFYWKKLNCEVCKVSLPDLVEVNHDRKELIPIQRPQGPYILMERVFYDRTKENADNSKMMILLNITNENQQIKLGRGHECDLRENDISVSRLHAYIKYQDGKFNVIDNNSKFGTLVLLRRNLKIEKNQKLALQYGRTVTTLALKHVAVNSVPVLRNPLFLEKLTKWQTPKNNFNAQLKPTAISYNRPRNINVPSSRIDSQQSDLNTNGSFLD